MTFNTLKSSFICIIPSHRMVSHLLHGDAKNVVGKRLENLYQLHSHHHVCDDCHGSLECLPYRGSCTQSADLPIKATSSKGYMYSADHADRRLSICMGICMQIQYG